jgi:hypothetical protein
MSGDLKLVKGLLMPTSIKLKAEQSAGNGGCQCGAYLEVIGHSFSPDGPSYLRSDLAGLAEMG